MIARFKRYYPDDYRAAHYRTDDSIIPFGLFWILYGAMTHTMALERVNQTRAITHALASAFGEKGRTSALTRSELVDAFLVGEE